VETFAELQAISPSDITIGRDTFEIKFSGQVHTFFVEVEMYHVPVSSTDGQNGSTSHEQFFRYKGVNGSDFGVVPMGKSYEGSFHLGDNRYVLTVLTDFFAERLGDVTEGATMVLYASSQRATAHKRAFPGCPGNRKWINLRVYIDQSFRNRYQYLGWNDWDFSSNLANHMNNIYGSAFNVNFWLANVEGHVATTGTRDGNQIFNNFRGWVKERNTDPNAIHLILAKTSEEIDGIVGLGSVGALCYGNEMTALGLWVAYGNQLEATYNVIEHEIGHVFGASHQDGDSLMCCCCALPSPNRDFNDNNKREVCDLINQRLGWGCLRN
jgi:hypothetical protein